MYYTEIINDNSSFLYLYRKGKKLFSDNAVIYYRKNKCPFNRLGITAGKKVGNSVCRNRAKRIIRQAYRENELKLPIGFDIVIVARSSICNIKSQIFSEYLKNTLICALEKEI
ncbi:MAG: ribonuclease P protein component [Oscillospiraceae bacterium]|nr:ribonuclease P protein component [Oscillospiraceae bacterium]